MFEKKQIFKLQALKKLLSDEKNCVSLVSNTRLIALPPFFLNDMKSGILYILNSMLKKYDRSLGGIVIGYQNIKVLMDANTGIIPIGTSEMEVNISVEFYIFQPKIGSLLEGVVNKKSNNHIGCLVHRYFNATILKPEETDFNDWICKDFDVGDKVTFKVKDLDFTSLLPNIEGIVLEEDLLHKISVSSEKNSDRSDVNKSISAVVPKKESSRTLKTNEHFDVNNFTKSESRKGNEEEVTVSTGVAERLAKESGPSLERKKEKKKKEEKRSACIGSEPKKEDCLKTEELSLRSLNVNMESGKSSEKKKKKKKKKDKQEMNEESVDSANNVEKEERKIEQNLERFGAVLGDCAEELKNEYSSDCLAGVKLKKDKEKGKEKKKKKSKNEIEFVRKSSECLTPREDSVFYSTQLEVNSEPRMRISFCSPIASGVQSEGKEGEESKVCVNKGDLSEVIVGKKEKKRKNKRKKEEEDESGAPCKKMKTLSGLHVHAEGLKGADLLEALYKDEVSKVMRDLEMSEEQGFKGKKNKRTKGMEKEGEDGLNELAVDEDKRTLVRGGEGWSLLDRKHQPGGSSKEELDEFSEKINVNKGEERRKKSVKGKETVMSEVNCSGKGNATVEVQGKQNNLNEEESHVKDKTSDKNTRKREKKPKSLTIDSLYERLLQEAKSAVDLVSDKPGKEQEEVTEKKESEPSDSSASSKKTNSRRKSKHKEKRKHVPEACVSYKNGSMYDVSYSPLKFDFDKSLFSDSDQSQASPTKKRKELNGMEATAEGRKAKGQNIVNEFCSYEKSESDKEDSEKTLKNRKAKEKRRTSNKKSESLFEKLLKQAKISIDFKGNSPSKSKEQL